MRRGFQPLRDRGRLLADVVAAMVAGASCLSDVEGVTRQTDLYGPGGGASDSTILRALSELAGQVRGNGLPGARMSRVLATVRAHAWQQIVTARDDGQLPVVRVAGQPLTHLVDGHARPITVVRVDATVIQAATMKPGVAGHFKGGIGHQCAMRRFVVFPVQPGRTRREVLGSNGLPDAERLTGQEHARKAAAVARRGRDASRDPRDMAKAGLLEP